MATMRDVALRAGVSTATVSHVLNNSGRVTVEIHTRVVEAIRELNYQPNNVARALRTQRSQLVSLVIPDLANHFYAILARGVQDTLKPRGYHVMLGNTDYERLEEEYFLRTAALQHAAGVIVLPFRLDTATARQLCGPDLPVVQIGRPIGDAILPYVYANNVGGAQQAVTYLLEQGRQRIAHIGGLPDTPPARERWQGYVQAHRNVGIEPDPRLHITADFLRTGGETAMRSLLEKGLQPDAVFAANDLMALGALHVLHQAGIRVPEEIAVIGFDDIDEAEFAEPPLTTVHQPTYDIGRHAAELLLMHIDQQAPASNHMILPCTFVRRFSA